LTASEEFLASTSLSAVFPLLKLDTQRRIVEDVEAAVRQVGVNRNKPLRAVARSLRSAYERENRKAEKTDCELDLV
jgi:hypothetical protein